MKKSKFLAVALTLAGAAAFAPASHAVLPPPNILAVGSSGVFSSMVLAMANGDANTGFPGCGSEVWTATTGKAWTATATDHRNASIPAEPGKIAVLWDNDAAPTKVCIYFTVDSIVGQRLFFAVDAAGNNNVTINLPASSQVNAGSNQVSFIVDTCGGGPGCAGLPVAVWNVIDQGGTGIAGTGSHPNVALTDIRPEDAMYGYVRAACTPANEDSCLGYGGLGVIGYPLLSTFDTGTVANVIPYVIQGNDPFTGGAVPSYNTVPVGAYPVMVFVSTVDNTAGGGLGWLTTPGNSPYLSNITTKTLTCVYVGICAQTQDLVNVSIPSSAVLWVVQREPLSGTYNTFEFQVPHSRDANSSLSQETGFTPTSLGTNVVPPGPACAFTPIASAPPFNQPVVAQTCSNPMNVPGRSFNRRYRGVGTGEVVKAVNGMVMQAGNSNDSIGYAFWGLGTFGGMTNLKYLTVDGVDPLFPAYGSASGGIDGAIGGTTFCSGHFIPTPSTFTCPKPPTFAGLKAGNYRIFNLIRAVVATSYVEPASGVGVYHLIQAGQDQLSTIPDAVPFQQCTAACVLGAGNTWSPIAITWPIIRAHYGFAPAPNNVYGMPNGVSSNNGTNAGFVPGGTTEAGGDMAGSILFRTQDVDFFAATGTSEIQGWIQ